MDSYDELVQRLKQLLKAPIVQQGIGFVVQHPYIIQLFPSPVRESLSFLVALYQMNQIYREHKETVADDDHKVEGSRGLWDSSRVFVVIGKMSELISSMLCFSKLIHVANKMGMLLKTMATSLLSVGARFAAGVLSAAVWFF